MTNSISKISILDVGYGLINAEWEVLSTPASISGTNYVQISQLPVTNLPRLVNSFDYFDCEADVGLIDTEGFPGCRRLIPTVPGTNSARIGRLFGTSSPGLVKCCGAIDSRELLELAVSSSNGS